MTLLADLQQQIARGQVVAIIGAGVSIGATSGADTASWIGLLRNGIAQCEKFGTPRPKSGWGDRQRAALDQGELTELLAVASQIESLLGAPTGGEYGAWLRDAVGTLKARNQAVLEALRDLDIPLVTTNYDGLIEDVIDMPRPVTWRDGTRVQRVLRGDERGVLHLHGYWEQPHSVVLGVRSYDQVLDDPHAQAVQSALALMKSLLFVGYGAGLADPNFSALLKWMRLAFRGSEYRHFRLCLDGEREEIQKLHPSEERIFAVGYGANHEELAPFLLGLRSSAPIAIEPFPPTSERASLPPRPSRVFGREKLIEDLVSTMLLDGQPPVLVLGGPGFGKSTLCLAALHEPRVAKRFGARRWFVRCDAASTAEDVLKEVALTLALPIAPPLAPRVIAALSGTLSVLVLDNAETPWEADALATEDLLGQLAGAPTLVLIATVRGQQRPHGPAWREPLNVTPLGQEDSRKAFLALAGEKHATDPHLLELLNALDGIPLAIELLAHAAEAEPNLKGLWHRWKDERVALLRRADAATRLVNAATSFELSVRGPRMTDEARQLLGALAILPDGIAHEDLSSVMPLHSHRAAATLRQVGLAFDEADRLRVLAPIREHVAAHHSVPSEAVAPILSHYMNLASKLGDKVGRPGGDQAVRRLAADARNIEEMLSRGLCGGDPEATIDAAIAHGQILVYSGLGTAHVLEKACQVAKGRGQLKLAADCILALGRVALARSDYGTAHARFEEARPLYQNVDYALGEANCIECLGEAAYARSDLDEARTCFEEARPLYQKIGSTWGEADSIKGLGDIAIDREDYNTARVLFEEVRPLYQKAGNVVGEANCIERLGEIALKCADCDSALARFEEARLIHRKIGNAWGEANCIKGLVEVALARAEYDTCGARIQEARDLYQKVGLVLGEANCSLILGQIALARSDQDAARPAFQEALRLYECIPEPYSIGNAHRLLARLALSKTDRTHHVAAARKAWRSIKRDDLIRKLDTEFGA